MRLRAERRAGELMAGLRRTSKQEASPNGRAGNHVPSLDVIPNRSEYAETLERTGIPRQTAHRWQQLAKVPEHEFEEALRPCAPAWPRARLRRPAEPGGTGPRS